MAVCFLRTGRKFGLWLLGDPLGVESCLERVGEDEVCEGALRGCS